MTRIAIPGAAGRMGRNLIDACRRSDGLTLGVATERSGHELIGSDAGVVAGLGELGVAISDDLEAAVAQFDVLIDFTVPAAALAHLDICRRHGKRMVIGTTGFSDAQKQQITAAAADIGVVFAPNMSVGVNLCLKLLDMAARVLADTVDIEVIEAHHRHKVDAPSGTALMLGEAAAEGRCVSPDKVADRISDAILDHLLSHDPDGFFSEMATEFLSWDQPWNKVVEYDFVKGEAAWFAGGKLNVSYNCIDRHLPERADQTAIIWEGDDPADSKHITYGELKEHVCKLANALKSRGVKRGDRVCIYMPMIPEAAYAMLACTRIGAVHSIVFGGFSPEALKDRIQDSDCQVVITADEGLRGGRTVPLKVIFENCLLSDEEKRELCRICVDIGVAFVKTSTGFGSGGATLDDVRLMRDHHVNAFLVGEAFMREADPGAALERLFFPGDAAR